MKNAAYGFFILAFFLCPLMALAESPPPESARLCFETTRTELGSARVIGQQEAGGVYLLVLKAGSGDGSQGEALCSQVLEALKKRGAGCADAQTGVILFDSDFRNLCRIGGKGSTRSQGGKSLEETMLANLVAGFPATDVELNRAGYARLAQMSPNNSYYQRKADYYQGLLRNATSHAPCAQAAAAALAGGAGIREAQAGKKGILVVFDPARIGEEQALGQVRAAMERTCADAGEEAVCASVYDAGLEKQTRVCRGPESAADAGRQGEEALLFQYVRSLPDTQVAVNMNGYSKLVQMAPANVFYKSKVERYEASLQSLDKLGRLQTADGTPVVAGYEIGDTAMRIHLDPSFWSGLDQAGQALFAKTLAEYVNYLSLPQADCVLLVEGRQVGGVQCRDKRCGYRLAQ